ncbi:hypothetical protein [Lysobacter sp. CA199]|uniref:hypothetical protein n=1 Tax=Lysobacter sp. CA199 TaxID=3455608 RepID=UPI003F8D3FD9
MKICALDVRKSAASALVIALISLTSACSTPGQRQADTQDELSIEGLITLPLRTGPAGFDRLTGALRNHFPINDQSAVTSQLEQQNPLKLNDGYVVRRYLPMDDGRHVLIEIDSSPCFPIQQAIAISRPDPSRLDQSRRAGVYLATDSGMSVGLTSSDLKRQCLTSLEIAETPR